jgi:HAD superfamily hydrolase (TIGR01509 family)
VNGSAVARLRTAVFDLDGTIVDTMPLVLRAVAHAISPFTEPPEPAEIYRRVAGPADRCLAALLGGEEHVAEAVARLFAYAREHGRETTVFAGAIELIDELRGQGRPVGLWTGRDRVSATAILEGSVLHGRLDAMVCGDDLATHKPDPEGLLRLAAKFAMDPAELIMVGDAEIDVWGAHRAGARAVLIHQGRPISADVLALRPHLAETPAAAFRCVRELLTADGAFGPSG